MRSDKKTDRKLSSLLEIWPPNSKYKACTKIFKEINKGLQNLSKGSETAENIQADLTKNQIKLLEMKYIIIDIERHS